MSTHPAEKTEVEREFPPIGSHRVRLLRTGKGQNQRKFLDIREHVSSTSFEGYTRRGIKLASRAEVDLLRDILSEILHDYLL
jgi:hypothetical protein